jgi:hypothetical protein
VRASRDHRGNEARKKVTGRKKKTAAKGLPVRDAKGIKGGGHGSGSGKVIIQDVFITR